MLEAIVVLISWSLIAAYHIHLFFKFKRDPLGTAMGITNHARRRWVENVMQERRDILAIQTFRNQIMAATFLASAAILISLGLLGVAFRPDLHREISHALNLAGTTSEAIWMFKVLILVSLFFSAFFNFTLSVRYINHAGIMINITETDESTPSYDSVVAMLNHGALHYTLGMRGFYLAAPIVLWLFGPLWMLAGTGVLIPILFRLDREA